MGGGLGKYSDTETGVGGLTSAAGGTALADNKVVRGDGTTGIQGSNADLNDTGDLALVSAGQLKWSTDTGFVRQAAGVIRATDGSTGIRSLIGGGAAVASGAALPLPTGRVFHVTGVTNITSITSTNFQTGAVITLIFDDVLTFTDGGNLVLAGNFVTTANDTITLVYDGTNWYETSRSVN